MLLRTKFAAVALLSHNNNNNMIEIMLCFEVYMTQWTRKEEFIL
jgi:hypothetical protein